MPSSHRFITSTLFFFKKNYFRKYILASSFKNHQIPSSTIHSTCPAVLPPIHETICSHDQNEDVQKSYKTQNEWSDCPKYRFRRRCTNLFNATSHQKFQ